MLIPCPKNQKFTEPMEGLHTIYKALKIKPHPTGKTKSVGTKSQEKNQPSLFSTFLNFFAQGGLISKNKK